MEEIQIMRKDFDFQMFKVKRVIDRIDNAISEIQDDSMKKFENKEWQL